MGTFQCIKGNHYEYICPILNEIEESRRSIVLEFPKAWVKFIKSAGNALGNNLNESIVFFCQHDRCLLKL